MPPPEESPTRTLQVALSAMGVVAVTVGLVVGGLVLGVSKYAGVDEVAQARATQAPATMSIPPYHRTPTPKDEPGVTTYAPAPTPSVDLPTGSPSTGAAQLAGIMLVASPVDVGPGERIDLNGSYTREGATLQVQRRQGGPWTNFPVTTTVSGGSFQTYVITSQTGTAQLRVLDTATGASSNVVTVSIG